MFIRGCVHFLTNARRDSCAGFLFGSELLVRFFFNFADNGFVAVKVDLEPFAVYIIEGAAVIGGRHGPLGRSGPFRGGTG